MTPARGDGRQTTVAVVDDADDTRMIVVLMLEAAFHVVAYAGGAAALVGIAASPPDVVLLDLDMPDVDGWEVLRRVRADPRLGSLPVLAFTASCPSRAALDAVGFDGLVEKPVADIAALIATVALLAAAGRP